MTDERWRQVEGLCHAALACPPEDRPAFLTRACAHDEALKREVESLLAQERDVAGFLSAPALAGTGAAVVEQLGGTHVGRRLGSYTFGPLLGRGGMGEVYRAHDDTLGRDVAIKVLLPAFVADPERRVRLEREARILATLNHPHIGAIFGVVDVDGVRGLVLELVDGETLAERLTRGALALEDVLPIARQIAAALEVAHEHGIVHRDLKPANIKITAAGVVKVLDFGLATLSEPAAVIAGSNRKGEASPTVTVPAMVTGAGTILGTAAYMAPEQAKGRPADKRSDVWAFGCVLFEMLAGRRAFEGDNVSDTLVAVLKEEPNWTLLPLDVPAAIRLLLSNSLVKDRSQRITGISTASFLLTDAAMNDGTTHASRVSPGLVRLPPRWWRVVPYAAVILATAVAAGSFLWRPSPATPPLRVTRFAVDLGADERFTNTGRHLIALSPDGTRMAYAANNRLYMRAFDQLDATPLRGTDGAGIASPRGPFFSADGQWVGYWSDGQIKKIAITGGVPISVAAAQNPFGASWGSDDTIVYGQGTGGVWRVSASGGTPENIIPMTGEQMAHGPQFLPDGRAVLFTVSEGEGNWDQAQIVVHSLETGARHVVIRGGTDARYVGTGHLVYSQGGTLFAIPFDAQSHTVTGSSMPVLKGIQQSAVGPTGAAQFSVAASGSLLYVPGAASVFPQRTLVWVDRDGVETSIPAPPRGYLSPRLSPDGTRIALDVAEENRDIWVWDLARTTLTRLTFDPAIDQAPVWMPDSQRLLYSSARADGVANLYLQPADGTDDAERLLESAASHFPTAVTPDGTHAILSSPGQGDLMAVGLRAPRMIELLTRTPFSERNGTISPDGRWLAYSADDSGQHEIYVRPFPKADTGRWQVSTGGGVQPRWSHAGGELFFRTLTGTLMHVAVHSASAWNASPPAKLFEMQAYFLGSANGFTPYDLSANDRQFLLIKPDPLEARTSSSRMILVQNWTEELKRLVSARTPGQ